VSSSYEIKNSHVTNENKLPYSTVKWFVKKSQACYALWSAIRESTMRKTLNCCGMLDHATAPWCTRFLLSKSSIPGISVRSDKTFYEVKYSAVGWWQFAFDNRCRKIFASGVVAVCTSSEALNKVQGLFHAHAPITTPSGVTEGDRGANRAHCRAKSKKLSPT